MKANEAPEKIYVPRLISDGKLIHEWDAIPFRKFRLFYDREVAENIEYTRTDAFIEKALKWYCLDCECNDNCKDTKCFFYRQYERYLKGGTNALPPKFSDRILNEDGSTSDKWCYRHFTRKMQDAFIEKACFWLRTHSEADYFELIPDANYCGAGNLNKKRMIEDFKKYMEGE